MKQATIIIDNSHTEMCVCVWSCFSFLNSKSKGQLAYWLIDLNLFQSWVGTDFYSITSWAAMMVFWLHAARPVDFLWSEIKFVHPGFSRSQQQIFCTHSLQAQTLLHGNQSKRYSATLHPNSFLEKKHFFKGFMNRTHPIDNLLHSQKSISSAMSYLRHLYLRLGSLFYKLKSSDDVPRTTDWILYCLSLHLARQKSVYNLKLVVQLFPFSSMP